MICVSFIDAAQDAALALGVVPGVAWVLVSALAVVRDAVPGVAWVPDAVPGVALARVSGAAPDAVPGDAVQDAAALDGEAVVVVRDNAVADRDNAAVAQSRAGAVAHKARDKRDTLAALAEEAQGLVPVLARGRG